MLYERIRKARLGLHLSQDYVAQYLGINRNSVIEIESGKRKVSLDELKKLSELFVIPSDVLLNGNEVKEPVKQFASQFSLLDEQDQQEILNMMEFKRMIKVKRNG